LYRGPTAASEPETQAIQNYVRSHFPDQRQDDLTAAAPVTTTGVFIDLHSYSQLVLWSWGFTDLAAPNGTALQTLGRKFAYFNGYRPQQAAELYPTDGTTDDFAYGELGLAAYTFELGTRFFQGCSTFENKIVPDNLPALIYALKVARTPYLSPSGPDTLNLDLSSTTTPLSGTIHITATVDDTRYNGINGAEAVQNVVAAEVYVDHPPWAANTTPIPLPMEAADGNFDAPVEQVQAKLNIFGLEPGRHTLFLRGQDADGHWGAISATFLDITGLASGLTLTPTTAVRSGASGTHVTFALTLTNVSDKSHQYQLETSGNTWPTSLSINDTGEMAALSSTTLQVTVTIPITAIQERQDVVLVTATSLDDNQTAQSRLTTRSLAVTRYLPLIRKNTDG
jgi:hypothetical protein